MMGKRKIVNSVLLHVVLAVLAVIWITPIVSLIVTSFSGYDGMNTSRFFPETWSIRNYTRMLFEPDTVSQFPIWFKNTLVIAIFVCLISTSFVLMVSYEYRSYAAAVPGLFVHDRYLLYFEVRQLNQQPYRYDSGVLRCIRTRLPCGEGIL